MQYENRQPREGINVTKHNPLAHFLKLSAGVLITIVIVVLLLYVLGSYFAKTVPFEVELALVERIELSDKLAQDRPIEMVRYLNKLAAEMSQHMELDQAIKVQVHYNHDSVFNAFATVGGQLVFYKGLLKQMPSENALAMVMAHEIAHVAHRDPIAGLSGGVASLAGLMMLTGFGGSSAPQVFSAAGSITQLSFNRKMETAADAAAIAAVNAKYGHIAGADYLFRVLSGKSNGDNTDQTENFSIESAELLTEFLQTHPLDERRIQAIQDIARDNGWKLTGEPTALPEQFQHWLR